MRRAMEKRNQDAMDRILLAWLADRETQYGGRCLVIVDYPTMQMTRPDLLAEGGMALLGG